MDHAARPLKSILERPITGYGPESVTAVLFSAGNRQGREPPGSGPHPGKDTHTKAAGKVEPLQKMQ